MRHASKILVVVALLVGILGLYAAAYLSLLKEPSDSLYDIELGRDGVVYLPRYRAGGVVAEVTFGPAHWVDRRVRPEHWGIGLASPYDVEEFQ